MVLPCLGDCPNWSVLLFLVIDAAYYFFTYVTVACWPSDTIEKWYDTLTIVACCWWWMLSSSWLGKPSFLISITAALNHMPLPRQDLRSNHVVAKTRLESGSRIIVNRSIEWSFELHNIWDATNLFDFHCDHVAIFQPTWRLHKSCYTRWSTSHDDCSFSQGCTTRDVADNLAQGENMIVGSSILSEFSINIGFDR